MIVSIISDIHFGIKKNSEIFLESQMKFFEKQFIPYLKEKEIKEIFILGDLFDNRNNINVKIMNTVYDLFKYKLKDFNIYVLVGNHDCYFNSTVEVNSLKFLKNFQNVNLIEKITTIDIGNKKIVMIPWIVDNLSFMKDFNKIEPCDLCFGHFNILGFHFNKIKQSDDGIQGKIFSKFKKVFSGHFHIRSSQNIQGSEIIYIGSPFQLTRADIDENRGFVVLDTDTLEYQHIDNNVSLKYVRIKYPEKIEPSKIKNNIIDVYISYDENYNEDKIDKYIKKIEEFGPVTSPNIFIEDDQNLNSNINLENYKFGSMLDLMKEYVNSLNIGNKEEIYQLLIELYNKSTKDESL